MCFVYIFAAIYWGLSVRGNEATFRKVEGLGEGNYSQWTLGAVVQQPVFYTLQMQKSVNIVKQQTWRHFRTNKKEEKICLTEHRNCTNHNQKKRR